MKKRISFLALILLIVINTMGQQQTTKAQEPARSDTILYNIFPAEDGNIIYQKVIEAPGKPKADIYKIIKSWAASTFTSQKDALQSDDFNTGLIIYKFNIESSFESPKIDNVSTTINTRYWQNLKVYIKDNRLKLVVDNLKVEMGESKYSVSTYESDIKDINEKAIQDYKKSMKVSEKMETKMRDNAKRYDQAVIDNFKIADKEIKTLLSDIEKIFKTGKSEFDF